MAANKVLAVHATSYGIILVPTWLAQARDWIGEAAMSDGRGEEAG